MTLWIATVLFAALVRSASACTALAVDGEASATGAAFSVENVDCSNCDFRLTYIPARDHGGNAQRPIYLQTAAYPRWVGYDRSDIYHPIDGQAPFKAALHIPQVSHTFGYYESACPLMNDQGLGIAESSCAAMLLNKAPGADDNRTVPVAYLDAATLMQIVLERCSTARCGAALIGELCETFGYLPFFGEPTQGLSHGKLEWDDAGEAYTLADSTGESWVVHVLGGVEGIIKSVWAAQRVPKGHVVVVANTFVLGELPEAPNEDYLFSPDLRRAALAAKLWDGKAPFHFSKIFAPDFMEVSAPASTTPIPLYSALRKWRLLNLVAPSLNLKFEIDALGLPFSVKAERKLSRRDIMDLMSDHYEGTEFDMTKGILAGPWGSPFRAEKGLPFAQVPRGISIMRSIYSTISETGPDGSMVWFAPDVAATSVYMPLDHRSSALSPGMHIGHYLNFTRESAFWAFDYVNNWMQLNYQRMSTEDVLPRRKLWQDTMDSELAALKSRNVGVDEFSRWQVSSQERIVADWWKLADGLVQKWNDFECTTTSRLGLSWSYPEEWAQMVGFSNDIHPIWVQPAAEPRPAPAGYVPAAASLPRYWDHAARVWTDWVSPTHLGAQPLAISNSLGAVQLTTLIATVFAAGSLSGFALGRYQPAQTGAKQEPLLLGA